ncbi:MAG TPA: TfoX/Sxy family protein [Thermoanaerobaculia bacterium]|nr:TfoX/Sxy family protein [Thermoanaerobaculia bacterium]HXK66978.1 TfoX/Sxy family protein [Thermoanaerobaculia bacterium]
MKNREFLDFVLDQLSGLGSVNARAMFGGYGLYEGSVIFGVIHRDTLYLKTDEITRMDYILAGMSPFKPNDKQTLITYYEIPTEILENSESLVEWAIAAIHCQRKRS